MSFDVLFSSPQYYNHRSDLLQPVPTIEDRQLNVGQCLIPGDNPPFTDTRSFGYPNRLWQDPDVLASHLPRTQILHDLGPQSWPSQLDSVLNRAYDLGQNMTYCDTRAASNPCQPLCPTPLDQLPPLPFAVQGGDQSNDGDVVERFIPLYSPPSLRPHFSFYHAPARDSTCSSRSRRRRGARAIEHEGVWLDEEELLMSMSEPDGTVVVHQCHWDEDRFPCHLWIKGNKSCINTHLQQWHGETPGRDKLGVNCRWSACGKRMLKESIARHVLSIHLGEVWECQGCSKEISRSDAYGQHAVKSSIEACRTAGALVTYSADTRVIDARTALSSGGRAQYASG